MTRAGKSTSTKAVRGSRSPGLQAAPPEAVPQADSVAAPQHEHRFERLSVFPPGSRQERRRPGGLPPSLQAGIESLSGVSMDDVRVHYRSPKPSALGALAYTQGSEIHIGSGQEKHLAHEAWHVVQQKQARVKATGRLNGAPLNDDPRLESEAQRMGSRAEAAGRMEGTAEAGPRAAASMPGAGAPVVQRFIGFEFQMLRSNVEVEELQDGDPLPKWGPIQDGKNLELQTTEVLRTAEEVSTVVTAMADLGRRVSVTAPDTIIDIGDRRITVKQPDNSAQPQVNFDLPLHSFGGGTHSFAPVLQDLRAAKLDAEGEQLENPYFGVDNPSFAWDRGRTNEDVGRIHAAIAGAPEILSDTVIKKAFAKAKRSNWPPALLQDIRGYVVLLFSQKLQNESAGDKGLTKDVPLLSKTGPAAIFEHLAQEIQNDTNAFANITERDVDRSIQSLVNMLVELDSEHSGAKADRGRVDLYEHPHPLSFGATHSPSAAASSADVDDKRAGILLELRRAQIIPYQKWTPFALDAYRRLGSLFHPDDRVDQSDKESTNDSDRDSDSGPE